MGELITAVEQLTPTWLTDVLRQAGALAHGHVAQLAVEDVSAPGISRFARLHMQYAPRRPPAAPARLFLKLSPAVTEPLRPFNGRPRRWPQLARVVRRTAADRRRDRHAG